jgi:hypothetical protein
MKAIRLSIPLAALLFMLLLGQSAVQADGPFTPTFSLTMDEVAPDDLDILPADDECPVGAACKLLTRTEVPDGQPGGDSYGVLPSPIVGFAGDALIPDGAICGNEVGSTRLGPVGRCTEEGTIVTWSTTFLDATTDASTTTGSVSDLCSFSHWPTQLNGVKDDFMAAHPGVVLVARRVGCSPNVKFNKLIFAQGDGSLLVITVGGDPTIPRDWETCGPSHTQAVGLGLSADNPDTPADEGGIPLLTCTAAGTQTFTGIVDRKDTPPGDVLVLEDTAVCSPNTPPGSGVSAPLNGGTEALSGMNVTFSTVTSGGTTSVVTTTTGPPPPTGFKIVGLAELPLYFDINTDASYSGDLTVCARYDETQVVGPEEDLRLMQRVDGDYVDVTASVDTASNIICGTTSHLSIFVVTEPIIISVGGMVELQRDTSAPAAQQPDSAGPPYVALAAAAAAGALALTAAAWYARRRRLG